jgi:hypothetical protein
MEDSGADLKTRIKSATSKSFWLHYCTLAGYRMFCSALIGLTGKNMSGSYTVSTARGGSICLRRFCLV